MDVQVAIRTALNSLYAVRHLPGVAALIVAGEQILSTILGIVAAHPLIFLGVILVSILVYYLPDILNFLADWIKRLRIAAHNLSKNWNMEISQLVAATNS